LAVRTSAAAPGSTLPALRFVAGWRFGVGPSGGWRPCCPFGVRPVGGVSDVRLGPGARCRGGGWRCGVVARGSRDRGPHPSPPRPGILEGRCPSSPKPIHKSSNNRSRRQHLICTKIVDRRQIYALLTSNIDRADLPHDRARIAPPDPSIAGAVRRTPPCPRAAAVSTRSSGRGRGGT
jgi:hypothetical protein